MSVLRSFPLFIASSAFAILGFACDNDDRASNRYTTDCDSQSYQSVCYGEKKFKVCENNTQVIKPCADNQVCLNGVCGEQRDCDPSETPACLSPKQVKACENGNVVAKDCQNEEVCSQGKCLNPQTCSPACENDQECVNAVCQNKPTKNGFGNPCTCTDANCTIKIDFDSLSSIKSIKAHEQLGPLINELLKESDGKFGSMDLPNFFSSKNNGCADVPKTNGASIGCLRDFEIKLPSGLASALKAISPESQIDAALFAFKANKGTCFSAAIDVQSIPNPEIESQVLIGQLINDLARYFNTGDPQKLTTCPAGSELISVDQISNEDETSPQISAKIDLCIQSCRSDADCRQADGYKCTQMPSGTQQYKTVCMHGDMIDNFFVYPL